MDQGAHKRRRKRLEGAGATPANRGTGENVPQDLLASFCTLDTRVLSRPVSVSTPPASTNRQRAFSLLRTKTGFDFSGPFSAAAHRRSSMAASSYESRIFRSLVDTLCEVRQIEGTALVDRTRSFAPQRKLSSPDNTNEWQLPVDRFSISSTANTEENPKTAFALPGVEPRASTIEVAISMLTEPATFTLPGVVPREVHSPEPLNPLPTPSMPALPGIECRRQSSVPSPSSPANLVKLPLMRRENLLELESPPLRTPSNSPSHWTDVRTGEVCQPVYLPGPVYGGQTVEHALDLIVRTTSKNHARRKSMPTSLAIDGIHLRKEKPVKGALCTPSYRGSRPLRGRIQGSVSPGLGQKAYYTRCSGSMSPPTSSNCPGSTPGGQFHLSGQSSSLSSSCWPDFTQASSPQSDRGNETLPSIVEETLVGRAEQYYTAREWGPSLLPLLSATTDSVYYTTEFSLSDMTQHTELWDQESGTGGFSPIVETERSTYFTARELEQSKESENDIREWHRLSTGTPLPLCGLPDSLTTTTTPPPASPQAQRCLRFNSLQWKKMQQCDHTDENWDDTQRSNKSRRSVTSFRYVGKTKDRRTSKSRKRCEIKKQLREQPLVTAALRSCFLLTIEPDSGGQPSETKTVAFGSVVVATAKSIEECENVECVEVKRVKPMRDVTFAVPSNEAEILPKETTGGNERFLWTPARLQQVKSQLTVAVPSTAALQRALQSLANEIVLTEERDGALLFNERGVANSEDTRRMAEELLNHLTVAVQERNENANSIPEISNNGDVPKLSFTIQKIHNPDLRSALMEIERLTNVVWAPMQIISICSLLFEDLPEIPDTFSDSNNDCYDDDEEEDEEDSVTSASPSRASSPIDLMMAATASESPCSLSGHEDRIKQSMLHTVDGVFVYRIENFSEFYVMGAALGSGGEGTVALCIPRQVAERLDLDTDCLDIDALREQRWKKLQPKLKKPAKRPTFNGLGLDADSFSSSDESEGDNERDRQLAVSNAVSARPELREVAFAVKITPKEKWRSRDIFRMAHVLGSLRHPNVLRHRAFYEDKWSYYFVMDLADGPELLEYLSSADNVSQEQCRELMRQVLSALAYLHSEGIVHRDVKPENFVCRQALPLGKREDEVRQEGTTWLMTKKSVTFHKETEELGSVPNLLLLDFGLACYKDETAQTEPNGTDSYMAPELFTATRQPYDYGPKVDLWAAGIILSLMLTGSSPFGDEGPRRYAAAESSSVQKLDSFELAFKALQSKGENEASTPVSSSLPTKGCRPDGTDPEIVSGTEWSHVSSEAKDLVQRLLIVNPKQRLSAEAALKHPWFSEDIMSDTDESSCVSSTSRSSVSELEDMKATETPSRTDADSSVRRRKVHVLPELIRYKWLALHEATQRRRAAGDTTTTNAAAAAAGSLLTPTSAMLSSALLTPRGVYTPNAFTTTIRQPTATPTSGTTPWNGISPWNGTNSLNSLD